MAVRGDRVNGKWRVHRADPHDMARMPAIGILISKSTPTVGVVQMFGPCTAFSGLVPGDPYLVGAVGVDKISQVVPNIGGNGYTWGQQIGHAVASDLLLLNGNFTMIEYIG